jgi:flagellar biosynthesis/type III secretory pathway protein FliH
LNVEKRVLLFEWECEHQYAAELLRIHLEEKYHNLIQAAYRKAYEQGYKDGRGRKRKKTWFSRYFQKENGRCCS